MRALLLLALQLEPVYSREAIVTCHPACIRLERGWFDAKVCCEGAGPFESCIGRARGRHPEVLDVRFGRCGGTT